MITQTRKGSLAAATIAASLVCAAMAALPPTAEAAPVKYIEKPCIIKSYTGGRSCALYGQPVWVQLGQRKSQLPFYVWVAKNCAAGGTAALIVTKGVGGAQTFFLGCVGNLAQAAVTR
ncbi:hypothetical protein [Mycobacteroides abscessus]|uniref:hypothetical protein n=1 Tax=Mycobacteroides abscessus TaxID=36809 RepID=UPI0005E58BE6|nr:hypothetical protein [Mycobacteroides abscessus]CPV74906.1 Uncharacterised protein [Mycobacteroides abscessus]